MGSPQQHRQDLLSKGDELECKEHLSTLKAPLPSSQQEDVETALHTRIYAGQYLRQALIESTDTSQHKDHFRLEDGFGAILAAFEALPEIGEGLLAFAECEQFVLDYVQTLFSVLSAALHEHRGNQRFFQNRIDGGGWQTLKLTLLRLLSSKAVSQCIGRVKLVERLFGCLLACATNDETVISIFARFRASLDPSHDVNASKNAAEYHRLPIGNENSGKPPPKRHENHIFSPFENLLASSIDSLAFVHNADALVVLLQLWMSLQDDGLDEGCAEAAALGGVIESIQYLGSMSTHNLAACHGSNLLSVTLSYLVSSSLKDDQLLRLRSLALLLLDMGVSCQDDARFLYSHAASSTLVAGLLLEALKTSRTPSYVHFNLSLHGFSSIELPAIGKPFPPESSSAGYTISMWLNITKFDSDSHTTLFGAYESTQTCFIMVYLEKDSRNLILQTSVTSTRPSVRFKSTAFQVGRWYHLVIAHRKPSATISSRASLFVNGDFVEQVRSNYPSNPPDSASSIDPRSAGLRNRSIQAFFGTPQDLSSRLGKGLVSTQWRLASAHLFGEALTDELIAVHFQLGPKYNGNYQDCLGSFQTYSASAALNIRNEMLHPGRDEKSDIVSAIRNKASTLLPESRIILSISPSVVMDDDDHNNISEKQLLKGLNKEASKNLRAVTRGGCNALAINGSIPSINEALQYPYGFAVLTGDPAVIVPRSLDNASWAIGGCAAVGLALVDAAETSASVLTALNILLESVKDSWRNSEAMERENGFGVLATLLAGKIDSTMTKPMSEAAQDTQREVIQRHETFSLEVLKTLLTFLGYDFERPRESVINNALAYRILLVDVDTWRNAAPTVQRLYYKQFVVFGVESKYHYFNAKRLAKMRITKRWLEALKSDLFTEDTFDQFLAAFKVILTPQPSAESLRSLAMYITYARHKRKSRDLSPLRLTKTTSVKKDSRPRKQTLSDHTSDPRIFYRSQSLEIGRGQLAIRIMRLYASILCEGVETSTIKKFAKTVTNRWLLFLLADDEPEMVILASQILARLMVINGASYVQNFIAKTAGITVMQHRLKRWWHIPAVWRICLAIFFGKDVASVDMKRPFDRYNMLETFGGGGQARVACPEMLPVLTSMLQVGLRALAQHPVDSDLPLMEEGTSKGSRSDDKGHKPDTQNRVHSSDSGEPREARTAEAADTLKIVCLFLADIRVKSGSFRDFTVTSSYVQELLTALFPIVVGSDAISPEQELHARAAVSISRGNEETVHPSPQKPPSNFTRAASPPGKQSSRPRRVQAPRRMSSYVFVNSVVSSQAPSLSKLDSAMPLDGEVKVTHNENNAIVQEIVELWTAVVSDQLFHRKDFPGLGLYMKVAPGSQEHQAYFMTFILRNTLSSLSNTIRSNKELLLEPRVLSNLARFTTHLSEAVYEGWFIDGVETSLEFIGNVLEYLQIPDIARIKSVRLCSQAVAILRSVILRIVLLRLSEYDESTQATELVSYLEKLVYWQTVILVTQDGQDYYVKLLCYLLYHRLVGTKESVRLAAANLWRIVLIQRQHYGSDLVHETIGACGNSRLSEGFSKIMEVDNEVFLDWVIEHRDELDSIFLGTLGKLWTNFVVEENRNTQENFQARTMKRRERLKVWQSDRDALEETLRRYEISGDHWRSNIYTSENIRRQRASQDYQDNINFNLSTWSRMEQELRRPCGVHDENADIRWQLDQTEGRNRMRKRLIPDRHANSYSMKPKPKNSQGPGRNRGSSLSVLCKPSSRNDLSGPKHLEVPSDTNATGSASNLGAVTPPEPVEGTTEQDDDFEIVDEPQENYEDKNRKVMRSLERGDQVEHVLNLSRIIGLEACEGLLILGKIHLYLLDNLFQRSDGEIVNVWQAPQLERDPYVQMISGREAGDQGPPSIDQAHEARNWRWADVLSISKRRFLFRDVAIEIFFVDGRSYLLTCSTPILRDDLYQKILNKIPNTTEEALLTAQEDVWRIESVKNPGDETQTLGSRFTNVFANSQFNPATKSWIKGDISNFHYLMLVNTMAGRTFNDLTQYPVFPWVLADYTSEELDLSNPKSFRDLTKPMGCQTPERQSDFRERYHTFAEMNEVSPSFHYGTHYSSAMIVTSYLIRLQPFVQSYLLLQGGTFDHPDRLFYSVEKAWSSASKENMSDVRELVPEFYYLPEFLINSNRYDFGMRQGDGGAVNSVALPPWAKGDPKVFIARQREALESEYVSKNLHHWIDLIFGHKQRGDAAIEATNVFHHLSYHGARDLDTISDPVERLATIGIIHNFGQTPYQVFQKSHPPREDLKQRVQRLDTAIESLTRLPFPVLGKCCLWLVNIRNRADFEQRPMAGFFRLMIPPAFDKYMEWGFVDGSVRFYMAESKKLIGLFEHVHQGQIACAIFADSKTLVTAGMDCTVSVWGLVLGPKTVDLQTKACLFGHRASITTLAVSRSFSVLLSASSDGQIILWDLNRLSLVRVLGQGAVVECACINDVTGMIMLCRARTVSLYTLNGEKVLDQDVCHDTDDRITACAFYEGSGNEYLERDLVFIGQRRGIVNVWNYTIAHGKFVLEHLKRMDHLDQAGYNVQAAMTAVLPRAQAVYTGDDDGKVYEWDCIRRQ